MGSKPPITCHGMYPPLLPPPALCPSHNTDIGEPNHSPSLGHNHHPSRPRPHPTVLDSSIGKPAQAIKVHLLAQTVQDANPPNPSPPTHAGAWVGIGTSVTNADGRCTDLLPDPSSHTFRPGIYQIMFETEEYFERTGRKSFYPFVQVGREREMKSLLSPLPG